MSPVPITVDTMRPKLLSLDVARDLLATTEPLSAIEFSIDAGTRFQVDPGWQHGIDAKAGTEQVNASLTLGGTEFPLSKDAVLAAASICGLRKDYTARCPAELLTPQLNYWFQHGLADLRGKHDYQLLTTAGTGATITRAAITPFSNVALLQQAVDGIEARFGPGTEILADYKLTHTLRRTHLRLIVPAATRILTGAGVDDHWSLGIQFRNSLTGDDKTSIDGYLFCWTCTNGQTDSSATSGVWTRRSGGTEDDDYAWARTAVDHILGGLEPALDAVQALTLVPVTGEVNTVLRDLFSHYKVPLTERSRIIDNLVDSGGDLTMYTVMNAITEVANAIDLDPAHVDNLLRMGGDIPHTITERCEHCRRMMPH
jgi:hypothetical protein